MKRNVSDFSNFADSLCSGALVYLFGTGISAALTGKPYSWWNWIQNGLALLKNRVLADQIGKQIETDHSAETMIAAVGEVIRAVKEDDRYREWMQSSFEKDAVRNVGLSDTLKKLLLTQDIFATTNYDLFLEQATGLDTLSYEQPELVYPMLESGLSTHVLHIHGVYDSGRDLDSIIADQEQYERVLNDQGAQFIQNILGTKTLVLIGCGKTTDDPNVARFLRFAGEWLKLDRPGYYLCTASQVPEWLPEHFTAIPYGDSYDNLPAFLDEMATLRLEAKISSHPMVAQTAFTKLKEDAYGLEEYHYSREHLKFCGRKMELAQLHTFTETDAPVSWWAIAGQGGAGKSRLAYEFIRNGHSGYFSFFLDLAVSSEEILAFHPFNNTCVVIDYVKGNEKHIADLFMALCEVFQNSCYKLRILFLERDNSLLQGSWYQQLENSFRPVDRARFRSFEYNVEISSRTHRFLYLEDLDDPAVLELIADICQKNGLPGDAHRDKALQEEYRQKFEQLKFRPLFLQLFVEAWIGNGGLQVDYRGHQDLLRVVLKREQERLLNSVRGDTRVCSALLRLLVRAGISDVLTTSALPQRYQGDWDCVKGFLLSSSLPGVQRKELQASLLGDAQHSLKSDPSVIRPLYPDIIKEAMFLYYIDEEETEAVWDELWDDCPRQFASFLSRALLDFYDNTSLRETVRRCSADGSNLYAMEARLALLQNEVVRTVEEGPVLYGIVREEYEYWRHASLESPLTAEKQLVVMKGLDLSIKMLLGWSDPSAFDAGEDLCALTAIGSNSLYQIDAMLEHTRYLVEKQASSKDRFLTLTGDLIDRLPQSREKTIFQLKLLREQAVSQIGDGHPEAAWELYETVCDLADMADEQMSELYAYFTFSCCQTCYASLAFSEGLDFSFELQDMAVAYASGSEPVTFNDKIHYYYLHAKLLQMEKVSLVSTLAGMPEYVIGHIDGLISEIERNEMIADFSGLLVGAWALKLRRDRSVSREFAQKRLAEVDQLLERYPDNRLLAEKSIDYWTSICECVFHGKVPKEYVDRAYSFLLRYPKDAEIQDNFHELLERSTEAYEWEKYYSRREVVAGHIQNHHFLYIRPDSNEREISHLSHVRIREKVGANDPCPCGSGKKFKKCCRGKGIYD